MELTLTALRSALDMVNCCQGPVSLGSVVRWARHDVWPVHVMDSKWAAMDHKWILPAVRNRRRPRKPPVTAGPQTPPYRIQFTVALLYDIFLGVFTVGTFVIP